VDEVNLMFWKKEPVKNITRLEIEIIEKYFKKGG
jgi:hypothetical protein